MKLKEICVSEVYKRDKKLRKEDVINVMKWVEQQPHLPNLSELETAIFLHSCYYNNEMAKITIDTHFTVKTLCSDIFGSRNPRDPQVQTTINSYISFPIPKLSPDGTMVIFVKFMDVNPDNFMFPVCVRCFDMITMLYLHQHGPPNGVMIVFDMTGATFSHFLKINVVVMKKFLYYLQEGMPIRLKGLHFCNTVSFIDKLMAIMKPFMKKEILSVLGLHSGMETVYEHVPKDIFPQEYGGTSEPVEILHERYKTLMNNNEEFFKHQESQRVDESKRPGKPKNIGDIFGVEGTFKRLEVD